MNIPTPAELGLPPQFTAFRPHQVEALERILLTDKRVVMLDAPTGSGKTLIAAAAARMLGLKAYYTCSTKTLQDQFADDYPYARVLKGRANYPTLHSPEKWPLVSADDCVGTRGGYCPHCAEPVLDRDGNQRYNEHGRLMWSHDRCPYRVAKRAAMGAEIACLNTSLLLTEANAVGGFSGWPLGIIDEADMLEGELMRHVELVVPSRFAKRFGIESGPRKRTKPEAWMAWADDVLAFAGPRVARATYRTPKEKRNAEAVVERLRRFHGDLLDEKPFVNCTDSAHDSAGPWIFRPVSVAEYGQERIWRHADRWLLMSATFLGADVYCRDLGLERDEVEWISLPNTFPAERRPVLYAPTVALNKSTEDYGKLTKRVVEVCRGAGPVLVHTVSYRLADVVTRALDKEGIAYVTYTTADERQLALEMFKARGGVLVAPSMERGVDLPDDLCRAVVIVKVPYPSLGDKQISARLYGTPGGKQWYAAQTIRSIVQSAGRGMRHAGDECETWVLDAQFERMLREHRKLFPQWFRDALWLVENGGRMPLK